MTINRLRFAAAFALVLATIPIPSGPAAAAGSFTVTSPDDVLRLPTRLVFSTVNGEDRPGKTLTIRNTDASVALSVTGLAIGGTEGFKFRLAPGQPTSFSVAPGSTAPVTVLFRPPQQDDVENYATLTISTSAGTYSVALAGLDAFGYEGGREPKLADIARVLGYTTNIGFSKNKVAKTRNPYGDELISPYWTRVDSSKPVELVPLARYSGRLTTDSGRTGWHVKGSTTKKQLYIFPGGSDPSGGENQRLLPKIKDGGTTTFSPSTPFGLWANSDWSDDGLNGGARVHNFRFYPAKGQGGTAIPNAWFVGNDIGSDVTSSTKNYDYQDEAYLLTNARPELTPAPLPGSGLNLDFSSARAGTVADKDGEGTGFTGVQQNAAGTQYDAGLIDLEPASGVVRLTSTSGTNSKAANSQKNALELGFDATRANFRAQARVVGPLNQLTTDFQHQALFMGPDLDNFVKVEAEHREGGVSIVVYFEQNATGVVPVAVPVSGGSIQTLDLFLDGNLGAGTVTAAYRINSSDPADIVYLSPAQAPRDVMRWFSSQARAGVLVSNQGNSTSFTGVFDRFSVEPA
ncbi:MAG TPA: hypothetical protein VF711_05880 [Acidimicrobiales bacterium]|jgi:hypothetical protein